MTCCVDGLKESCTTDLLQWLTTGNLFQTGPLSDWTSLRLSPWRQREPLALRSRELAEDATVMGVFD
jgi:hypothetical protein